MDQNHGDKILHLRINQLRSHFDWFGYHVTDDNAIELLETNMTSYCKNKMNELRVILCTHSNQSVHLQNCSVIYKLQLVLLSFAVTFCLENCSVTHKLQQETQI